jgi:hypothetical protein
MSTAPHRCKILAHMFRRIIRTSTKYKIPRPPKLVYSIKAKSISPKMLSTTSLRN